MTHEHWSSPNGCHPDCPVCDEENDDETSEIDLTGLSDNEKVFHANLAATLAIETSVLAPEDADGLALVLVNELPLVYSEAYALLEALKSAELSCTQACLANGIGKKTKAAQIDFLLASFDRLAQEIRVAINKATPE